MLVTAWEWRGSSLTAFLIRLQIGGAAEDKQGAAEKRCINSGSSGHDRDHDHDSGERLAQEDLYCKPYF